MHQPADDNLIRLLSLLRREGYRFTAVTPATHQRIVSREDKAQARGLRDVFGWNLPFAEDLLAAEILGALEAADAIEAADGLFKSKLRVASIEDDLFLHSGFPAAAEDSVFFGPDTYRFARFLAGELPRLAGARHLVDLGAGTGAGGIVAARMLPALEVMLTDVNPLALRLAAANAAHAGIACERLLGSGLDAVEGAVDLIIANPPYVMDEDDRTYRNGGGMLGAKLSLDWASEGARRLAPGGTMLLYTGVAIVDGCDSLHAALAERLEPLSCTLRYEEIDPDVFGEELDKLPYRQVERIAAVGAVIEAASSRQGNDGGR